MWCLPGALWSWQALVCSSNEQKGDCRLRLLLVLASVQGFSHRNLEEGKRRGSCLGYKGDDDT